MQAFVHIMLVLQFLNCSCNRLSIHYDFYRSDGSVSFPVSCLANNAESSRAARYSSESGTCETLDESWNTNPTFDSGFMYLWIISFERQFREAFYVESSIPAHFELDSRIDVVFQTTENLDSWFGLNIGNDDLTIKYLHFDVRPSWSTIVFNSESGGLWDGEIRTSNPVISTNTVYTASFRWTSAYWDVSVDGVNLLSFTHRQTFSGDGYVVFSAPNVYCQRIIYYGP